MIAFRFVTLAAAAIASVSALPAKRDINKGIATFYSDNISEGNCGWWSTPADHIVALNSHQYGSTDEVSEHCGRLVRITNKKTHKTLHAVVSDSCPTCDKGGLDLSSGLFSQLSEGDMDVGELPIEWSFIN